MVSGRAPRVTLAIVLVGALAAPLAGCTLITDSFLTNDFSGDPFPVNVDLSTGAIVVGVHVAGEPAGDDRDAVLDLLSPITVIDSGPMTVPSVLYADLTMLGLLSPGQATRVDRARFPDAQLVALHPCADTMPDGSPNDCVVGNDPATRRVQAIIGADSLAGDAVRLRLGDDQIFVLADVGGDDRGRTLSCDTVFSSPYRGGGTLVIAGTELSFGNRRITLQACLGPDADPDPQLAMDPQVGGCPEEAFRNSIASSLQQRGADALFVVSTSIGTSILGAAAYQRYVLAHPGAPTFDALPDGSVYLPSGKINGKRATIDRIALVGTTSSNALSPCRQLYAHRLLSALGPIDPSELDGCLTQTGERMYQFASPCKDGSSFCPVPAMLELTPSTGIDVLVVDDTDPTLQALRTELRPDQAEVDGILGTELLSGAELDIDYPHDRVLARCTGKGCSTRPQLAQQNDRCAINRCMKGLPEFRDLAPAGHTPDDRNLPGCPPP